jgi:ubiquinone/menaquinone biosynthesis C-methylase UbiE
MLGVARENLRALGLPNVDLVAGDVSCLPLKDVSVDAGLVNMVLHHREYPAAMLRKMVRVVRPGGTVTITDEVDHPYAWGCATNTLTSGRGSARRKWSTSSVRPGWKVTITSRSESITTYPPRPRLRSPTSASSPPGAGCAEVSGFFPAAAMPDRGGGRVRARPRGGAGGAERAEGTACLDLCCGDGYFTTSLSCLARPCKVDAMDLEVGLIEYARRHVVERGEGELVAFAVEDAMRLARYVPEPVGFVLLANTFHGVPHNTGLACGVRKVLAPGRRGHVRRGHTSTQRPTRRLRYYGAVFAGRG